MNQHNLTKTWKEATLATPFVGPEDSIKEACDVILKILQK